MHIFLAIAFIFSILTLFILFKINDLVIKRKKIPKAKRYKFIKNRLATNIIISCLVFVFVFAGLPSLLWQFGEKETSSIEKVEKRGTLYAVNTEDSSMYAGLVTIKGKQKYAFRYEGQLELKPELVDVSKVEVIEINTFEVLPHYEKIAKYKRSRLKDKGILTTSVNNMYSDIDSVIDIKKNILDWKETMTDEKVKLYIPKDSIIKDYKLK